MMTKITLTKIHYRVPLPNIRFGQLAQDYFYKVKPCQMNGTKQNMIFIVLFYYKKNIFSILRTNVPLIFCEHYMKGASIHFVGLFWGRWLLNK